MATKKPVKVKKVSTVRDESFTELDMYCIWLDEYYRSMKKAGLPDSIVMGLLIDKSSYPDWIKYGKIDDADIAKHIEEDED